MSLEDLGNIGEFVAAVVVLVSLIYLALQIRQNTAQMKQSAESNQVSAILEGAQHSAAVTGHLVQNREFAHTFRVGAEDISELSDDERIQFDAFMNIVFAQFSNNFFRLKNSMISGEELEGHTRHMLWFLRQPGVADWWSRSQRMWSQGFRDYVEKARSSGQPAANTAPASEA